MSSFHLFTNIIVPLITQVFFYGGTGPVKSVVVKKNYVLEPAKIPISGHLAYHCFDGLSLIKKETIEVFLINVKRKGRHKSRYTGPVSCSLTVTLSQVLRAH